MCSVTSGLNHLTFVSEQQNCGTFKLTMMFNDDGTTNIENDPLSKQRELIVPLMYHYNGL